MRRLLLPLLLACAARAGAAEPPMKPACEGTLSGAVTGTFACTAVVATREGRTFFSLDGVGPLDGVASYAPGAFELEKGPAATTYTLETLGMGRASVAKDGGALYMASKTTSTRGEVTLVLASVKKDPKVKGAFTAHGTYRARLLPAHSGKEGEVLVEARF